MASLIAGSESSLSKTNLISLWSRLLDWEIKGMLQTYGILISANHLTIALDDKSCGQGGEMRLEWEGGGVSEYPRNVDL